MVTRTELMVLPLPQFIVDSPICAECKGECCKTLPGICWPEDIKPLTSERIIRMVLHERYAIDWYEGDPRPKGDLGRVLYVRPAVVGATNSLDPAWGGECTFLTDTGCSLTPDERPRQCLALVPAVGAPSTCKPMKGCGGKKFSAMAWLEHQEMMEDVVSELS